MARRRKKSFLSSVLKTLPPPVAWILESPVRLTAAVLILGGLISAGIVSVQWIDGRPRLQVNQEKVEEIKQKGKAWAEKQAAEQEQSPAMAPPAGPVPPASPVLLGRNNQEPPESASEPSPQRPRPGLEFVRRLREAREARKRE